MKSILFLLITLLHKANRTVKRVICFLKGHDYPCAALTAYSLCFCRCCGREFADGTIDDISPISNDDEFFNEEMFDD